MVEKTVRKNVGKRIKLLRKSHGFSQTELADFCGTSKNNISDIELGKHYPSLFLSIRLCFALTINFKDLFEPLLDYCANLHNDECYKMIKELEEEFNINVDIKELEFFDRDDLF